MRRPRRPVFSLALLLTLSLAAQAGCGPDDGLGKQPIVLDLSEDAVVLGETLFFYGKNFRQGGEEGITRLTFDGVYVGDDGSRTDARASFTPLFDGYLLDGEDQLDVLRWSRFGPFRIPFAGDLRVPGLFEGVITATNVLPDGDEQSTEDPVTFSLRVDPSIAIEELQPIVAECGSPALRGLGGMAYMLKVRAIGLTPETFQYTINNVNGQAGPTYFEHSAYGPTDELGVHEDLVFNPVPDDVSSYTTNIRVVAVDAEGRAVETALPLSVHRPVEFYYDGSLEVAQFYEPVPVSGCMPGSIANRVEYAETTSETLQQSVTITVSQSWSNAHGVTNSTNWMEGYTEGTTVSSTVSESASLSETESTAESYGVSYNHSDSNSVGFSSTDGESWGFDYSEGTTNAEAVERLEHMTNDVNLSDTVTVEGNVSIPGVASVGGSNALTAGVAHGTETGEHTTNRTETRQDQGYSTGGLHNETNSYGSTTTDSHGTTVTGSYALSSTTSSSRSYSDTEARSESRTYSLGGSSAVSDVVTEGMSESESRTWVESSTHTTLMSYGGFIPVDRYGVFYRQTVRMVRTGYVRSYDLCGRSEIQGKMQFNEWTWAPALAIGESCSPSLPKPDLPKAQCLIPPCD